MGYIPLSLVVSHVIFHAHIPRLLIGYTVQQASGRSESSKSYPFGYVGLDDIDMENVDNLLALLVKFIQGTPPKALVGFVLGLYTLLEDD